MNSNYDNKYSIKDREQEKELLKYKKQLRKKFRKFRFKKPFFSKVGRFGKIMIVLDLVFTFFD